MDDQIKRGMPRRDLRAHPGNGGIIRQIARDAVNPHRSFRQRVESTGQVNQHNLPVFCEEPPGKGLTKTTRPTGNHCDPAHRPAAFFQSSNVSALVSSGV